ncbi:VanZ family protein [Desulfobulbus sp. F1]|nr:VanZ family protein [Desulfobulbus sp. F1]
MMRLLNLIKTYWLACTVCTLAAITVLSLSPLPALPPVPGKDKSLHLIAYAALIFPAGLRHPKYWLAIPLMFILYSGMIELIQPYVNRSCELLDLAANTCGIGCGLLFAEVIRRLNGCRVV